MAEHERRGRFFPLFSRTEMARLVLSQIGPGDATPFYATFSGKEVMAFDGEEPRRAMGVRAA